MSMSIPIFLLFAVYGVVNTFLPVFLRNLSFSVTAVGALMALFEVAGLVFPLILSMIASKKGSYGFFLVICGISLTVSPFLMMGTSSFWLIAACLALYALGYKGAVPLSDVLTNNILGENHIKYGRVRVMGSIGFVMMALIMQFYPGFNADSNATIALWMVIPAVLFTVSLFIIPTLLKNRPPEEGDSSKAVSYPAVKGLAVLKEFSSTFWFGMLLLFLGSLGLIPAQRFFSLYVQEYLQLDAVAGLWAISALAEIPFMFFSNRFLKRYGSVPLIAFCLIFIIIRTLLYICIPNFTGAVLGQLCNSITYGLFHPAAVLFVANTAPKKYMVIGMSLYSVLAVGSAYVIGSMIGGLTVDLFGYPIAFGGFMIFPVIALIIYGITVHKNKGIVLEK